METLFNRDINEYYNLPWERMFYDLKAIKRNVYQPGTQVLVKSFGKTDQHIWKHFFKIIKILDIPAFFIQVQTNNSELKSLLDSLIEKVIPGEEKINVIFKQQESINTEPHVNNFNIPDTICLMPFVNLELGRPKFRACCQIKKNLADENGNNFSVYDHNFTEVFNSQSLKNLRTAFLNGEKLVECSRCWEPEQYGRASMRTSLKHHADFGVQELTTNYHSPDTKLTALDIKLTTLCNLKCRICDSSKSSAWYQEIKHNFSDKLPKIKSTDWLDNNDSIFWQSLKNNLSDIQYITFSGGEPLLDRKHHKLLEYLLAEGKSDTFIHYNTNGTIFPDNLIEKLLSNFNHVGISFSIDNISDKFNYERFGNKNWDVTYNILKKFSQLDRDKFKLDLYPTFSVFNILDIENIKNLADELDFGIHFGFVEFPNYFSVMNIPLAGRQYIINKLKKSKHDIVAQIANNLDSNIYYNVSKEFWNEINRIDKVRGQCFADTYPIMNKIMRIDSEI